MTVVALVSVKHSPGATTAAVALATARGGDALVIEADPAGGDIAARAHLSLEPGLASLAAASRHAAFRVDVLAHVQELPTGVQVLVAPTSPEQASTALAAVASRLPDAVRSTDCLGLIDCGRWTPSSAVNAVLAGCDAVVVATEPTVSGIEHVRTRLNALRILGPPVVVLLIGDRPYRAADIEATLGLKVVGALAVDPRGALLAHRGPAPAARRSLLVRTAASALDALQALELTATGAAP